jgi:hypothetical protein
MTDSPNMAEELLVRRTLERYMRFNDDRDLDRILELFAPDAVYRVGGEELVGREAIGKFLSQFGYARGRKRWTDADRLMIMPRSAHLMSNPVIDVDGDTATAESDFAVVERNDKGHAYMMLVGRYRDRLKKIHGLWVFVERTGVSMARRGAPEEAREPWPAESLKKR